MKVVLNIILGKFYLVSTTDKDAILEVAQKEKVDGVLAYASDPAAPTAAYVGEKLKLPTNPYSAVEILCNKDRFRAFLHDHGFNAPISMGYQTVEDAALDTSRFRLPVIIKPVDSSGSKGATVLHSWDNVNDALKFAFSFSRAHRVIVGQYGELYQCNEQGYIGQITYLDVDGNPAPTNAGYTILKRTYHRDGTADTDMYFDAEGNPKALSKGQYGIKRSGKVNLLLDRNGNVMLCVDNLLNGFPCMVVVFGCVVCLLLIVLPKSLSVVLTIVYVAFILYETLMFRESGNARTNFVLFSYAGKFLKEQSVRVGVINNIWLFIPLGTGLYRWFQKKWVLLIPFVVSVAIETTQYITGLGMAEFNDVFGNTIGGWIGVLVAWMWLSWKMSVKNRT